MLSLIKHRGPDDYKIINDHHVLLGHCRLSIIDINGGKQPLEYVYNLSLIHIYHDLYHYMVLMQIHPISNNRY